MGPCQHFSDAERAISGTWVLDEVRLAVTISCKVVEILEVYEYAVTQYDKASGEGGLFVDYVNTLLKLKTEASGYPSWVRSPSDEDRYIAQFKQNEGIILNKDSIHYNAPKRELAKLCLNSMWGKLGESAMRTQTQLISDPQDLYRFLATPDIEVATLVFAGDSVCWLSWRHSDEAHAPMLHHTNDVLASYVTAERRMNLYSYLGNLQKRALYTNTDSVIYIQPRDGAPLVNAGDCLGDMTSELKPCEYISEFVRGGPKNYAYQVAIQRQARNQLCV